jgi:hypothetical protein
MRKNQQQQTDKTNTTDESKIANKIWLNNIVMSDCKIPYRSRVIFNWLLFFHHNSKSGQCNPSTITLGGMLHTHQKQISRALNPLVKAGYLIIHPRWNNSNEYEFNWEKCNASAVAALYEKVKLIGAEEEARQIHIRDERNSRNKRLGDKRRGVKKAPSGKNKAPTGANKTSSGKNKAPTGAKTATLNLEYKPGMKAENPILENEDPKGEVPATIDASRPSLRDGSSCKETSSEEESEYQEEQDLARIDNKEEQDLAETDLQETLVESETKFHKEHNDPDGFFNPDGTVPQNPHNGKTTSRSKGDGHSFRTDDFRSPSDINRAEEYIKFFENARTIAATGN